MVETAELTLTRVAHYPMPGMNAPAAVRFSPDGRLLTYLWSEDATLVRQLWTYDIDAGQAHIAVQAPGQGDTDATVSAEEALRRERLRMRGYGVTSYAWAEKSSVLLVPMRGRLFLGDGGAAPLRELETHGEAIDPHLDPGGHAVAFVQEGELWMLELGEGAVPRRLTFDASPRNASGERVVTNGLAEFIAQEEMGRSAGFWWSPDGSRIAFVQVDCSAVTPLSIPHLGEGEPAAEVHRYPFAGTPNARVKLGIVSITELDVRWVSLNASDDFYLARVDWTPDQQLVIQVQSRDQRNLDLLRFDFATGAAKTLFSERSSDWVNLHDDLRFVSTENGQPEDYRILWSSERTGFRHLYLYTHEGSEPRQLTRGAWPVDRVAGVHGDCVYFLAGRDTPLERHVFRVSVSGGEPQRLTDEPGMHAAVVAPSGECFADIWDSPDHPPSVCLRSCPALPSGTGQLLRTVFDGDGAEAARLALEAPEFLTVSADDGTPLHAALYRPLSDPQHAAPLIVSVYGGPHVQQVSKSWGMTVDLRSQYLARHGYAVLKLDNRGSARRGHAFESAISGALGSLEVRDQIAGLRAVATDPGLDPSRIGIYGWSYGGYMSIMCLLTAPDVFRAAVAGAPVTDWDGYDTHYTERYMRLPAKNPEGYRASSALAHVAGLRGALLIIHGMIDENVHFRHTARLVEALIRERKPFDLLPFPSERHMPRGEEDRVYLEERLIDHFRRHL